MISVVTATNEAEVMANPYDGMSLAEACCQLELDTERAINEFQLDILLTEHAYLYENGRELEYVDEAGNMKEEAEAVKMKIGKAVAEVAAKVKALWNKFLDTVTDWIGKIKEYFMKIGISAAKVDSASKAFGRVFMNRSCKASIPEVKISFKEFKSKVDNIYANSKEYEGKNIHDMFLGASSETEITLAMFKEAKSFVFDETNNYVSYIKGMRDKAVNRLEGDKLIIKAVKGDDMNDRINDIKAELKLNSTLTRDLIKVNHAYIARSISILKAVLCDKEMVKELVDEKVIATKAVASKAVEDAKETGKNAGKAVADTAKNAKDAVVDGGKATAKKAKEVIEEGKKKGKDATEKVKSKGLKGLLKKSVKESAVEEDSNFDGNYFRI